MLQYGQMTDFGKTLDQLQVKLSLELNVIETNGSFLQKESINKIGMGIVKGDPKYEKWELITGKFPTTVKYGSDPPTPRAEFVLLQILFNFFLKNERGQDGIYG